MPRSPRRPLTGLANTVEHDELINDLYPSQSLKRYGSNEACEQRWRLVGSLLPANHPLQLWGDAEAVAAFWRTCAERRADRIRGGYPSHVV